MVRARIERCPDCKTKDKPKCVQVGSMIVQLRILAVLPDKDNGIEDLIKELSKIQGDKND
jgi:hypothetical protein